MQLSPVLPKVGAEQRGGEERRRGHPGRGEEGTAASSEVDEGHLNTRGWELRGSQLSQRGPQLSQRGRVQGIRDCSQRVVVCGGQWKWRRGESSGREKKEKG